jgi:HD-GYP domain-containing protein (c-di-GMP phosphodiesterase class II)
MVKIYTIEDDSERYIPINLDELVPGTRIPFEIFTRDGNIIKSLLDKGSTYSLFARKMIEKQAVGSFFIKQGNALSFDEYMHNAARLKKLLLDPHFFESRYREFRDKWFIIDKHVINSGMPFSIPLGAMKFPVFGEIPFSVDNDAAHKHLLDLNSDIAIRKQDIDAYYNYLHTVLFTDWIEDPLLKIRIRREKVKVWCYRLLEEAYNNGISQNTLAGLYKHIGLIMTLMANSLDHIGTFLVFDVSDMFLYIHSTNVCLMSMMIGRLMNLEEDVLLNLGICAMLHDVGRVTIDNDAGEISANEAEMEIFKSHVLRGKELLDQYKDVPALAKVVALTHHERVDGSGYVYGLTGDKIHQFSKIVGVADTFENHVVTGFKNNAIKRGKAIEVMVKNGQKFDPDILKTCIRFVAGLAL